MLYVLENEQISIESAEASQSSTFAEESAEASQSSTVAEESAISTESVTSDGDTTESIETTEEPKEWPKGGSEAFTNHALPSLVFGMLGIFLVLGLIAIATMALNKLFPGKKDN